MVITIYNQTLVIISLQESKKNNINISDNKAGDQTTDMLKLKKTIVKYLNDGYVFR